jgi:hypothetical protein
VIPLARYKASRKARVKVTAAIITKIGVESPQKPRHITTARRSAI